MWEYEMNDNLFIIMLNNYIVYVLFLLSNISKLFMLRFKLNICYGNEVRNEDIVGVNYFFVWMKGKVRFFWIVFVNFWCINSLFGVVVFVVCCIYFVLYIVKFI